MAAGDGHRSLVNLYLEPLPPTPIPASGMTAPPPIPSPPTFKTPPLEEIPYFLKPKPSPPYVSAAGVAADRTTPAIDTPAPTKPHLGPMSLSVRALQYLPIPLLVLSDRKTVILANEAMGRFLRVPPPMLNNTSRNGGSAYPQTGTTEVLLGMSLNDLAVDVFEEDATLCLVAWDLVLASLTEDEDGIEMLDDGSPARLRDTTMEVHVPYFGSTPKWRSGPEGPVRRSQMTVSPWRGDDGEVYFTLTFKSAPSERQTTLELPFDMDELNSDTTVHRPAPGMSEKITVLKEALIDVMEIPVFAMWADGSVMVPNRAGFELTHPPEPGEAGKKAFNRNDFMANLRIFTEGFERELSVDESPLVRIVNTQQPFDSMMVGMFAGGHRRLIDVGGKCVYDKHGEFVGALISMRDVTKITEMQKILDTEGQRNEVMFRDMLDSIPQMVLLPALSPPRSPLIPPDLDNHLQRQTRLLFETLVRLYGPVPRELSGLRMSPLPSRFAPRQPRTDEGGAKGVENRPSQSTFRSRYRGCRQVR